MDIIEQIKKLASDAVDVALQKFDPKRIGAQAERLGLFQAHIRSVTNETLTDLLRERNGLFSRVSNEELFAEIERRELKHLPSYDFGYASAKSHCARLASEEKESVLQLADQIRELAEQLCRR